MDDSIAKACVSKWVVDTGAAYHLVDKETANRSGKMCSAPDLRLSTANGFVTSREEAPISIKLGGMSINARVLERTPKVLSIGRLVQDKGWTFEWSSKDPSVPRLIEPNGDIHRLEVEGYVPVCAAPALEGRPGSSTDAPRRAGGLEVGEDEHSSVTGDIDSDQADDGASHDEEAGPVVRGELAGATSKEDRLKREAQSVKHQISHIPKNPYCIACQRGKLFAKPARRVPEGAAHQCALQAKEFGDHLMIDHLILSQEGKTSTDERCALAIKDYATGHLGIYPGSHKNTEECLLALHHYMGGISPKVLHSDNAQELRALAQQIGVAHSMGTPYRHTSNAIVERAIGLAQQLARTILYQSGLSMDYWPRAISYSSLALNWRDDGTGCSPWRKRHHTPFRLQVVPFGCHVVYRRPDTHSAQDHKFSTKGADGILLGYTLNPGHIPQDYIVLDLEAFRLKGTVSEQKIYRVKEIVFQGKLYYPVREARDEQQKVEMVRKVMRESCVDIAVGDDPIEAQFQANEFDLGVPELDPPILVQPPPPRDSTGEIEALDPWVDRWDGPPQPRPGSSRPADIWPTDWRQMGYQMRNRVLRRRAQEEEGHAVLAIPPGIGVTSGSTGATIVQFSWSRHMPLPTVEHANMTHALVDVRSLVQLGEDFIVSVEFLKAVSQVSENAQRACFVDLSHKDLCSSINLERFALVVQEFLKAAKIDKQEPMMLFFGKRDGNQEAKIREEFVKMFEGQWSRKDLQTGEESPYVLANFSNGSCIELEFSKNGVLSLPTMRSLLDVFTQKMGSSQMCSSAGAPTMVEKLDHRTSYAKELEGDGAKGCASNENGHLDQNVEASCKQLIATRDDHYDEEEEYENDRDPNDVFENIDSEELLDFMMRMENDQYSISNSVDGSENDATIIENGSHTSSHAKQDEKTLCQAEELPCADEIRSAQPRDIEYEPEGGKATGVMPEVVGAPNENAMIVQSARFLPEVSSQERRAKSANKIMSIENRDSKQTRDASDARSGGQDDSDMTGMHISYDYADCTQPLHRHKLNNGACSVFGLVTRQIKPNEKEFHSGPCQAALHKELSRLRLAEVWNEEKPLEWESVKAIDDEAHRKGIMVGRLFAIMGEKFAEESRQFSEREYKARVVFGGHRIETDTGRPAHELFTAASIGPNNMVTARTVIALGALKGRTVQVRDAEQAYIQSRIDSDSRPATYVRLPKSWRPSSWESMKDPVCRLQKSLYGHPESGALWETHLAARLVKLHYKRVEVAQGLWESIDGKVTLTTYVDDLLMTGERNVLEQKWHELGQEVNFKEPPQELTKYLGTVNSYFRGDDGTAQLRTSMGDFLISAVNTYRQEIGSELLKAASTPYIYDEPTGEESPGLQAPTAASHLMKIMYAARMCRPDITTGVQKLSPFITKWSSYHDRALKRLMAYIQGHADYELRGRLHPDDLKDLELHVFVDADLAGDKQHTRSQSGSFIELAGMRSGNRWPLAWASRKQPLTAGSSAEAELISLAQSLRKDALPLQMVISQLLGQPVPLVMFEDNSACIQSIVNGYSPNLRHLSRTLRISIGTLHELVTENPDAELYGSVEIRQVETTKQKADVFTKSLPMGPFQTGLSMLSIHEIDHSQGKEDDYVDGDGAPRGVSPPSAAEGGAPPPRC